MFFHKDLVTFTMCVQNKKILYYVTMNVTNNTDFLNAINTSPQVTDLESQLDHMYSADRGGKIRRGQFHLTKAVLSPDTTMVFGDYQYKSMRELAAKETNLMACLFVDNKVHLNVVLVDFVGISDIVSRVIQLNYVKHRSELMWS